MMLSASFLPYPPAVSEDVFLCKSNEAFAELNTAERLYTFDVQYDRWNLSFTELYRVSGFSWLVIFLLSV